MASLIPSYCNLAVDVGTDHAYLPILLITWGKSKEVIATDIAKDPLQQGQKNIEEYGLENKIDLRMGDGLWPVEEWETPDVIIIAGLGGTTIIKILAERKDLWQNQGTLLILQPMDKPKAVREYIINSGYKIEKERLIVEKEKFYPIIYSIPGKEVIKDDIILEVGPRLIDDPSEELIEYINNLIKKRKKIITNLKKASKKTEELERKIKATKVEYDKLNEVKCLVSKKLRDNSRT